jgi:hypothetical protein
LLIKTLVPDPDWYLAGSGSGLIGSGSGLVGSESGLVGSKSETFTFTSVFKDIKSKRSHEKVEIKVFLVFLTFFAC